MATVELQQQVHTAITLDVVGNEAETKTKDNDAHFNNTFKPHSLDINLENPMENVQLKYDNNYRLVWFFILTLSMWITGNLSFFTTYFVFRILVIIYNITIILLCVLFFCFMVRVQSKKNENKRIFRFNDLYDNFSQSFNLYMLSTKNNFYELYIPSMSFVGWLLILNASINNSMREIFYHLEDATECGLDPNTETKRFKSLCAVNNSVNYVAYILVYGAILLATGFKVRKREILGVIQNEKEKILNKYQHTNIKMIDSKIIKQLEDKWQARQLATARKLEITIYCVAFMIFHIGVYGMQRNKIFSGNISGGAIVFALYMNIIDSVSLTYIFFIIYTFVLHYSFPAVIMAALSSPIYALNIDYLIGWWELRHYYKFCVVDVYGESINSVIFYFLATSILFEILIITTWGVWNDELIYSFIGGAVYSIVLSFLIVAPSVGYYKNQLSHSITINKERLQMKRYSVVESNENIYPQYTKEICDFMVHDIENNSKAINVLNINIDQHFMLFLRATTISFAIAVFIEVFI